MNVYEEMYMKDKLSYLDAHTWNIRI